MLVTQDIKDAKRYKKYNTESLVSKERRRVFGSTLTNKELEAINIKEYQGMERQERTKKIITIMSPIAVTALSATAISEGRYYAANGKFGIPSFGFGDRGFEVRVK
ncbi:hypothetical protein AGMMS49975_25760 [Clostridia bacterium]|nr:hypothetical protein AGMMS49975_25760 [Clostridia bacterium]